MHPVRYTVYQEYTKSCHKELSSRDTSADYTKMSTQSTSLMTPLGCHSRLPKTGWWRWFGCHLAIGLRPRKWPLWSQLQVGRLEVGIPGRPLTCSVFINFYGRTRRIILWNHDTSWSKLVLESRSSQCHVHGCFRRSHNGKHILSWVDGYLVCSERLQCPSSFLRHQGGLILPGTVPGTAFVCVCALTEYMEWYVHVPDITSLRSTSALTNIIIE